MKRGKIHGFYKSGKKNQRKKHHSLYAGRKGTYKAGTCPSYGIKFSDRRENCRRICRAGDVHPAGYEYGESGRTESGDLSVEPGFCAYPAFVPAGRDGLLAALRRAGRREGGRAERGKAGPVTFFFAAGKHCGSHGGG